MNVAPKTRANIVSFVVVAPYMFGRILHDDLLSQRAWAYVTVATMLVSLLLYQWVYHRQVPMHPTMVIVWNSLASWMVVYSLARWHGMARTYPYRRERMLKAVGFQWVALVASIAWASGLNFYMPTLLATTCGITLGVGMFAALWLGGQEYRLRAEDPQTGTWCYFDFRDPTFFGPRGLNLANGWSLALAAAGIAPMLLAEWLYHHAQG